MLNDLDTSDVTNWSIDCVANWMRQINFDEYIHEFKRQKINGQALILLNEDDIRQLVTRIGDRKNFYFHLKTLKVAYDKLNMTQQEIVEDDSNSRVHLS